MPATRNAVEVKARLLGTAAFCIVQRRTLGDAANIQRQCATGELEFDPALKRFQHVAKAARRPFDPKTVSADQRFSIKDQKPASKG